MISLKKGKSKDFKLMHYGVGALIKKGDKYLLIDRVNPPLGFACVAGHIDEGENAEQSLIREIKEESGLTVDDFKIIFEEELNWNTCSRGVGVHHWYLFECSTSGEIIQNQIETKSIGWYSSEEIKKLNLEPVWEYWFKKLKVI